MTPLLKKHARTCSQIMVLIGVLTTCHLGAFARTPSRSAASYGGALVVGISSDVDTFNPLFSETSSAQEIGHLFLLGLADLDDKSEFEPELASSWQHSADYLKLTYFLRKDAVWSDGVPITAEDVKFTWDLLMDDQVASPRSAVTEYVRQVVIEDPHTVTFEFTKAYPTQMFDTAGEVLPKHILEKSDRAALRSHPFGQEPLSSGPFKLKKWVRQQYIEIVPNERYFSGRPYLDRVIFKIVPDNSNLMLQLQTGEVDMMIGVPPDQTDELKIANPDIELYPVSGRVYYFMAYNLKHPLFEDPQVRRALTMAVDRQGIIRALLYGAGNPCLGPLPPMLPWVYDHQAQELPFDPQAAKELLATKGWQDRDGDGWLDKDGKKIEFTLKTDSGNQLRSDVAVIVQAQLKKIGIEVQIETKERTALIKDLRNQDFQAVLGGWSTSFNVDPTPIFHSTATDLFNFGSYANTRVDELIEQGREEMNREKAVTIWQEMQRIVYEDQPYTFLFWKDRLVAVSRQYHNVSPIPLSAFYNLEKWYQASN